MNKDLFTHIFCTPQSLKSKGQQPEIVQVARETGHSGLFTPPHYSDLQPIELVWACVKSSITRIYSRTITFNDVQSRPKEEFEFLSGEKGSNSILAIIDHVDQVVSKFLCEIERDEAGMDVLGATEEAASHCELDSLRTVSDDSSISSVG